MRLSFQKASKEKDVKKVCEYTLDAFSESPDFHWSFKEIKKEINAGWELFGVCQEEEIVAAAFLKEREGDLLTKNTAVKMTVQGSGYSHEIKKFFEQTARKRGLKRVYHYCGIDNFRAYSLNEKHRYKKTDAVLNEGKLVEWVKKL